MNERIIELVLDESKWLASAMLLSFIAVAVRMKSPAWRGLSRRHQIVSAMNLLYGCMLGIFSFGHLLAVTVKLAQGTLEGSLLFLYPLGLVLAVPAWWLALRVGRFVQEGDRGRKRTLVLNAWLGISLAAFGLKNLPLALPALLNIAYLLHSRRSVGWTIVTVTIVANLVLFVGSLIFLASGQSFEQFNDM